MVLMVLEPSLDLSSSQASAGQATVPRYFYDFFFSLLVNIGSRTRDLINRQRCRG